MLEFFKAPFLVLHYSYYILLTFLITWFVLFRFLLMILLSILNVTRHMICGNSLNWLMSMNLIHETLWAWEGSVLLILMLGTLNWFRLARTLVLLMWKWMDLFLRKSNLFRCWCWLSLFKLDYGWYVSSIAKTASKNIGVFIRSMKLFSPETALYFYKSTIRLCMKYCVTSGKVSQVATWNC